MDILKKVGRPRSKTTRDKKLNIRLNQDELDLIQECANMLNMTRTDAILRGLIFFKGGVMFRAEDIDKWNEINRLQNSWASFKKCLDMFSTVSGRLLQEGDARVMTVYNRALALFRSGCHDIDTLIKETNMTKVAEIIDISDRRLLEAENLKKQMC